MYRIKDGATGTMLMAAGVAVAELPEAALRHPRIVAGLHRDYLAAGAEIITTATFSLPSAALRRRDCVAAALDLAMEAVMRSGRGDVAACIGPCGADGRDEMLRGYVPVIEEFFKRGGAGIIIAETIMSVEHARIIHEIVRDIDREIPLVLSAAPSVSMTLLNGEPFADFKAIAAGDEFTVTGLNCFTLQQLSLHDAPVDFFTPSAGLPGHYASPSSWADDFVRQLGDRRDSSLIVGGCCGTTPQHISCLVRNLG